MTTTTELKPATARPRKASGKPKSAVADEQHNAAVHVPACLGPAKTTSKTGLVLDMLQRPEGATIEQLVTATGWLPHTTRAALTGLKRKGHALSSDKVDGGARVYRVTGSVTAEASA